MPTSRAAAWRTPDILRAALVVAGVWLTLQLLRVARSVFFLAFLGALFGITLSAGVTWLQRRGVPRALGTLLLVAAFFGGGRGPGRARRAADHRAVGGAATPAPGRAQSG